MPAIFPSVFIKFPLWRIALGMKVPFDASEDSLSDERFIASRLLQLFAASFSLRSLVCRIPADQKYLRQYRRAEKRRSLEQRCK